ncbi:hypothetical protein [Parasphingorhabdus sp.]|uniref:DUF6491 family protein n=1 Tax=Parasphingorhabdus sp. TaxID=2709688 RepID=UPI003266FA04
MVFPQKLILLVPVALALAACTQGDMTTSEAPLSAENAAQLAERFEDKVAGTPIRCVNVSRLGNPVPYGDRVLVYSGMAGTEYRNNLLSQCRGLDDDAIFVTKLHGAQLCRGDQIQTVDRFSGISGMPCRLGEFIPYRPAKKKN